MVSLGWKQSVGWTVLPLEVLEGMSPLLPVSALAVLALALLGCWPHHFNLRLHHHISCCSLCLCGPPCLLLIRTPVMTLRATWVIQDNLLSSRSLITSPKTLVFKQSNIYRFWGLGYSSFWSHFFKPSTSRLIPTPILPRRPLKNHVAENKWLTSGGGGI